MGIANSELVRIVDVISRDRSIDKESVFVDIETAMASAARKAFGQEEDIVVRVDRATGEIAATLDGEPIDITSLGRIAAQTAKQVMIQKIREAEQESIFEDYSQRVGQIVTGSVSRFESGGLVVTLGRAEGFLPRSEQIPGEAHQPGERVRAMILDVRESPHQVKIVLTRSHPDYIRRLFEIEVPEVGERIIEVRALVREAGYRTKVAVSSIDSRVDAVGACVGVRGSRIRNIVDELAGEKIDIVRWNESSQILIANALKPAEVQETALCFELGRATVVVAEDQLSLAIGRRGQNVRLAARLTGWDVDLLTPEEYNKGLDDMEKALTGIEGVEDVLLDKLVALGMVSLMDVEEVGVEPLVKELELPEELATRIVELAAVEAKRIAQETQAAKLAAAEKAAAEKVAAEMAAAETAGTTTAEESTSETEATTDVVDADPQDDGESSDAEHPAEDITASAVAPTNQEDPVETSAADSETEPCVTPAPAIVESEPQPNHPEPGDG